MGGRAADDGAIAGKGRLGSSALSTLNTHGCIAANNAEQAAGGCVTWGGASELTLTPSSRLSTYPHRPPRIGDVQGAVSLSCSARPYRAALRVVPRALSTLASGVHRAWALSWWRRCAPGPAPPPWPPHPRCALQPELRAEQAGWRGPTQANLHTTAPTRGDAARLRAQGRLHAHQGRPSRLLIAHN